MPTLTTTIEDSSPLISYSPEWKPGTSADNAASLYSQSSFTLTETAGATASFTFNGTGIQIFGAKRGNHGIYQVKIDDIVYPSASGKIADPGLYQQPLFTTTTLNQGLHLVTLTNQENAFVDIDFITWQANIGIESDKIFVNTFQDTDPSFAYLPDDSIWSTSPKNVGSFLGGSGHATTTPGASFVYKFKGEGVSLYGPVGPDGSTYSVQMDGGRLQNFTSNKPFYTPQTLLYHANSLGSGEHRLSLSVQPVTSGQVFAIDYATVLTTSAPSEAQGSQGISSLAAGAIAGMVISLVLLLGLLGFILYWLKVRARKRKLEAQSERRQRVDQILSSEMATTHYPGIESSPQPFVLASSPAEWPPLSRNSATDGPAPISYNPRVPQRTNSDASFITSSIPDSSISRPSYVSNSTSPRVRKDTVRLPGTAGQSLEAVSEEELRSTRRIVEGRPQDFGSSSSVLLPTSPEDGGLPPNYAQATQPYHLK